MESNPKAIESSKKSDADQVYRKFMCAMRRLRCLRKTLQRGSTGLPRTQLCYRLPGGGPLGRCHCCTCKNLPRSCQIRPSSQLIVFQALDTAPTTSPRESGSLLIEKRSSAGSSQNNEEDDESSECLSERNRSSLSLSLPSKQLNAASPNAQRDEAGTLTSIKSFVLSLMNQSLKRSIVADLNPVKSLTALALRKNAITDQGTSDPSGEALAYTSANLLTHQDTKKPSESSIDQKTQLFTDWGATSSPTETYPKAHLITHQGTTKSNEAVKPKRSKFPSLNVFLTNGRAAPSEKSTYRKSHSIVHHDKEKPREGPENVQLNTIATQGNADDDCRDNCDVFSMLKRMHSEVDALETRLDVLQSEITALKCGSKSLGFESDVCTDLNDPMPNECNLSVDSICAEQVEVDDKEFVSDIRRLFKKYTKKIHTSKGCSQEKLRMPCYQGTSLSMDNWSRRIKLNSFRRKTYGVEDSRKHLSGQQFASICDLCSRKDLPIVDDLESVLKRRIGDRPYTDIMLIILLRGDNVYHISVQVKSSNQVLGCILATHEAIEEAVNKGCFSEILTFCLIDKCKTLKPRGCTLNWPFKFLARVDTKVDKTDPCQLDSRTKNFITNVLGRKLPQ